ncbi:thymus-specific serine protease-like [Culicoides brevitarsis]|uniref:thymus-specific serine protease-like n=1 Tax=Culicoides brevitarsis TaxID=469753 RepID=UPI00307C214C
MKLLCVLLLSVVAVSHALNGFSTNFRTNLHREPFYQSPVRSNAVETKWIEQKLDNFNESDSRTWQMRYLENAEHHKPGGPMFIYVGGEWTVSPGSISGGHWYDMAKELNGILFYTEHRYYGSSHPTADMSYKNLEWLSVDQALADLAHFITAMKKTRPELKNSGVVMLGGSYSATMVTWFRLKYPHLVDGVWSSSAPLYAKMDFVEYKEIMSEAIHLVGGEKCHEIFREAYAEMEKLVAEGNPSRINDELKLCSPLNTTNQLDVWNMFSELSDNVAGLVQYATVASIENACDALMNPRYRDALEAYAAWTVGRLNGKCFSHEYSAFVNNLRQTKWNDDAMRQWMYQTCTEFGWYQTSGSPNQPFGSSFPIDLYKLMCRDIYDESLTSNQLEANAQRINALYGGLTPNMTNVYFTHGQLDPWRAMGRQVDLNEDAMAVVIPLIAHVADTGSLSSENNPELIDSKKRIQGLVKQWLNVKSHFA